MNTSCCCLHYCPPHFLAGGAGGAGAAAGAGAAQQALPEGGAGDTAGEAEPAPARPLDQPRPAGAQVDRLQPGGHRARLLLDEVDTN